MRQLLRALSPCLLGVALSAAPSLADDEHDPGFCDDWDWTGHKRKIDYWIAPGVDMCILKDDRDDDPPVADPTPANGFSLGDAMRVAAGIWNAASATTCWSFCEVANQDEACLQVFKAQIGPAPNPSQTKIDGILAVFDRFQHDGMGELEIGHIVYNARVDNCKWGITPGTMTYDPIILMLHELGHAMRLKDQAGVMTDCGVGHVMRGTLASDCHRWNKGGGRDPAQFRNPSAGDLCEAKESGKTKNWGCDTDAAFCDTNPRNCSDISITSCDCSASSIQVCLLNACVPDGNFAYLLVGQGFNTVTNPPGANGDLCLAGNCIGRYVLDAGVIAGGSFATDILNAASGGGGGKVPTCGGNICSPPGQSWNFQYWHRDGMNPSRFSKALRVLFQ